MHTFAANVSATGSELLELLLVSAVVMGLSHTIAKERIFAPLRDRLGGKETWLGYLVSCPYCVSHWLAFVAVPLMDLRPLRVAWDWGFLSVVIDWFLAAILVTVLAAFLRVAFWWIDETQALVRKRKVRVEKDTEATELLVHHIEEEHPPKPPAPH